MQTSCSRGVEVSCTSTLRGRCRRSARLQPSSFGLSFPTHFRPVPIMSFDIPRLLLPASFALLAACASNDKTPSSVVLSDDSRCPQTLQSGQQLIISLPSNPTTGYRWILHDAAAEQLRSLGPEVFSNPKADMIGGGGWPIDLALRGTGVRQRPAVPHLSTSVGGRRRASGHVRLPYRGTLSRAEPAASVVSATMPPRFHTRRPTP